MGIFRYIHFFLSLGLVLYFWVILGTRDIYEHSSTEIYWLAIGNLAYYLIAIFLAFILKDNRAFCKYVCPIPTMQKITSRFALTKISIDKDKCVDCHLCEKHCPMDIKLLSYKNEGKRNLSTECIICATCANVCPKDAIKLTMKFDFGNLIEELNYKS
ncbi:MAG: 4Fe-4S binding protein [Deltaproteobacteria bacterium]|nr:4Fe-4S binding protein [Deltaproteobacteria bacterium]